MTKKEDVVRELHKPARRNFKRRKVVIRGLHDLFQADLVEMIPYSRVNRGFRYILVVINAFSKYVWAVPVKSKTGREVTDAMESVLIKTTTTPPPRNLQTDMGREFYNKQFKDLMKRFNINHYSTFSTLKASIVERCNRTLKNRMWKEFSLQGSYKWLDLLPKIVAKYNDTRHTTTGYKPKEVTEANEKEILRKVYAATSAPPQPLTKAKFRVGDRVRISKHRGVFAKGYMPNWSNEIFTVIQIHRTNPITYFLRDYKGESIRGAFYEKEIQKVKHPDVYLVEKVLKRKGNKVYVKWLGMDSRTWIPKKDLL